MPVLAATIQCVFLTPSTPQFSQAVCLTDFTLMTLPVPLPLFCHVTVFDPGSVTETTSGESGTFSVVLAADTLVLLTSGPLEGLTLFCSLSGLCDFEDDP